MFLYNKFKKYLNKRTDNDIIDRIKINNNGVFDEMILSGLH